MLKKRILDHIVYAVPNLEAAVEAFEKMSGVRPMIGGRHLTKGTKNAVVNLGNRAYLEIIAIDEDNENVTSNRWMGVDLINKPKVTRWSLKSENLQEDSQVLSNYRSEMGVISGGQRQTTSGDLLSWEMILPLASPEVELVPFMTDWSSSSVHPTESMPDICRFLGFEFEHIEPKSLSKTMNELGLDLAIKKSENISIKVKIDTPNGIITI